MAERWLKPVVPLAIEHHPTQVLLLPDGRQWGDVVLILEEEDKERMRLGRVCAKCLEPFEQAWPERCPVCGAPIRTKQAEYFAQEAVEKPVYLGPSTTLADEREGLDERRRKEEERARKDAQLGR